MNLDLVQIESLAPISAYFALILLVVGVMLAIPRLLAPARPASSDEEPFESGIVAVGDTNLHLGVHFYPIAIFFVIFDLEAIFIYAWAVALRDVGWVGYFEMLGFVGVLLAALVYLWRVGALDWRTRRQRRQDALLSD